ncbi:protein of unknown function [Candidatus Filomicrobium marinum]|uniref:Uncharacterized protein n=1 Tax=Candidatus Filomicrobium marinum TaxID=1608628 RepID=A0A0D6JHK1_9HYPH|nr:protein of unknown function [Candidatus Filomicrobium marinum]CPR20343.1 protein of unknown function [Candidatus Filomicrobium marinum]
MGCAGRVCGKPVDRYGTDRAQNLLKPPPMLISGVQDKSNPEKSYASKANAIPIRDTVASQQASSAYGHHRPALL